MKLLDFGLARMVTSELTASNMMLGTLNYMAPEQVRGERTDHRADIFSFGVVLYEILSGRKAFQGDSFATTLYKILQDVPEPLQNIDASLPHEVVRLVEKSIAKTKEERYQDLSDLARDLALHRQHLALSDSDTMAIPVPTALPRRRRRTVCRRIRRVRAGFRAPTRAAAEVRRRDARPVGADDPRRRHDHDSLRPGGSPTHAIARGGSEAAPPPCLIGAILTSPSWRNQPASPATGRRPAAAAAGTDRTAPPQPPQPPRPRRRRRPSSSRRRRGRPPLKTTRGCSTTPEPA